MYSNNGVGMLGLEMPLHQSTQPQNPQHQQMIALTQQQYEQQHQTQLSMKQPTNNLSYNNQNNPNPYHKPKTQLTNSDEDEPISTNDHDQSISMERKRKGSNNISPWQRMKWTDNMVRLLIMAVYYIGDEAGNENGSEKKKPGSGSGSGSGGLLQKKGKWKSVSKAMMEKGFYVSPQQCEDKFNDLNKRYKRVNDILGKGTSCKVVENQNLLESMDLNPKLKEEVKKLLNSKHLFFREMCAYHNSCSHGSANPNHQQNHQKQESCSHSAAIPAASIEPEKVELGLDNHDVEDEEDDDDEHEDDEFDDDEDQDELVEGNPRKRARISYEFQELNGEIMEILQNRSKTSMEKKQWMMIQLVKFEEKGLKLQFEALKLEKERLKWIRFSSKKEREMEKMKIENERKRLENERMMLLLKQKEIELVVENHPQHQHQHQHQHQQYPPINQS